MRTTQLAVEWVYSHLGSTGWTMLLFMPSSLTHLTGVQFVSINMGTSMPVTGRTDVS